MPKFHSSLLTLLVVSAGGLFAEEPTPLKKAERIVFLGDSITEGGTRPKGYVTLVKDLKLAPCDLRKAFLDHLKENNPKDEGSGVLTTDGVHLNDAGNRLVAEAVLKAIGGK